MVSLKMKATASNKGFTLVELIVVITILAILGTIGFLSLQGYSANARDSKRTSDLRSLSTSVTTQATSGVAYTAFANGTASGGLTNIALAGLAAGTVGSAYVGGIPNYTTLGVDAGKFKDPEGQDYKVGTSTLAGGIFQFAATLEAGGTPTSAVNGNYNARTTAPSTSATGTLTSTTVGTPVTITIPAAAINQFKRGDTVSYGTVTTATVNSISGDGTSLTIVPSAQSASQNTTSGEQLALKAGESPGLVAQKGGTATGVVDNSTTTLPY